MFEKNLKIYAEIIDQCDRFERKGKTVPYTSANGHMFSLINKDGEVGFRYDKKVHAEYLEKYDTAQLMSHGANMRGYIIIHDSMLKDQELCIKLLNESFDYVMSLDPK